jgi:hypothetical protein
MTISPVCGICRNAAARASDRDTRKRFHAGSRPARRDACAAIKAALRRLTPPPPVGAIEIRTQSSMSAIQIAMFSTDARQLRGARYAPTATPRPTYWRGRLSALAILDRATPTSTSPTETQMLKIRNPTLRALNQTLPLAHRQRGHESRVSRAHAAPLLACAQ